MGSKQLNLIGQKFNRLLVIQQEASIKYGSTKKRTWLCLCDCGKKIVVNTGALVRGNTKSCGCLHTEASAISSKTSRHKIANPEAGYNAILGYYKGSAVKRHLLFNLTVSDFRNLISSNCYYCGVSPSNVYDKRYYNVTYNGIDRIDNNVGYTLENSVACCKMCNVAKNNHTYEEFMNWINRLTSKQLSNKGYVSFSQVPEANDFSEETERFNKVD